MGLGIRTDSLGIFVFPIPKYEVRRERIFLLGISSERIVSLRER